MTLGSNIFVNKRPLVFTGTGFDSDAASRSLSLDGTRTSNPTREKTNLHTQTRPSEVYYYRGPICGPPTTWLVETNMKWKVRQTWDLNLKSDSWDDHILSKTKITVHRCVVKRLERCACNVTEWRVELPKSLKNAVWIFPKKKPHIYLNIFEYLYLRIMSITCITSITGQTNTTRHYYWYRSSI